MEPTLVIQQGSLDLDQTSQLAEMLGLARARISDDR